MGISFTQALLNSPALAGATYHGGPGPGWHGSGPGWFPLIFPLFWLLVALTVTFVVIRWRRSKDRSAESTVRDLFARGELDEETYRARLAALRETRR